jgi:Tfp pilus tip-associated adhesin PilY1
MPAISTAICGSSTSQRNLDFMDRYQALQHISGRDARESDHRSAIDSGASRQRIHGHLRLGPHVHTATDASDTSVSYVYGIWDNGTPVTLSTKLVSQTLTEKLFNSTKRVRTSSSNTIDWTQKQGWTLQLPGGERVVGDGSYVSNGLYTFTTTNPTIVHPTFNGVAQPPGEDWLVEVRYDTGGAPSTPHLRPQCQRGAREWRSGRPRWRQSAETGHRRPRRTTGQLRP